MQPLPHVPIATAPLEVDQGARYEQLPHFVQFKGDMAFVGGINKPKLIKVSVCLQTSPATTYFRSHLLPT